MRGVLGGRAGGGVSDTLSSISKGRTNLSALLLQRSGCAVEREGGGGK